MGAASDQQRNLDTASGLAVRPVAVAALQAGLQRAWADPGRRYPAARTSRQLLDAARSSVARFFAVPTEGLFFLSSYESAVAAGLAGWAGSHPRLLVSPLESLAVLRCTDALAAGGRPVQTLQVDADGDAAGRVLPPPAAAAADLAATTIVVQSANLEIGTRQDLAALRAAAPGARLLADVSACAGREPLGHDWDAAIAQARLWGGPAAVAVLAVRRPEWWSAAAPLTEGAGGIEPAGIDVAAVAAAAMALEDADLTGWAATRARTDQLREAATATIPDCVIVSPTDSLSYLTMLTMLYVAADELVDELARRGWAVTSGASCTSDTRRPHHVLVAVGALTSGSLRISLGPWTSEQTVADFVADLADVVARLRRDAGAAGL